MTIAHSDDNMSLQAGFICVLNEAFDYPSQQDAYEAYHLAAANPGKSISEMGIKLSGLMLSKDISTCRELVDNVDFLVSTIGMGVDYFLELAQGKYLRLSRPGSLLPVARKLVEDIEALQTQLKVEEA